MKGDSNADATVQTLAVGCGCLVQAIFYTGVAYAILHFVAKYW